MCIVPKCFDIVIPSSLHTFYAFWIFNEAGESCWRIALNPLMSMWIPVRNDRIFSVQYFLDMNNLVRCSSGKDVHTIHSEFRFWISIRRNTPRMRSECYLIVLGSWGSFPPLTKVSLVIMPVCSNGLMTVIDESNCDSLVPCFRLVDILNLECLCFTSIHWRNSSLSIDMQGKHRSSNYFCTEFLTFSDIDGCLFAWFNYLKVMIDPILMPDDLNVVFC